jgi:hypothetical protein
LRHRVFIAQNAESVVGACVGARHASIAVVPLDADYSSVTYVDDMGVLTKAGLQAPAAQCYTDAVVGINAEFRLARDALGVAAP